VRAPSAAALAGVLDPLLVVSAAAVMVVVAGISLLDLGASCLGEECSDEAQAYAMRRALAAQATLRGIVTSASAAREA
jgi:hypothetical protein